METNSIKNVSAKLHKAIKMVGGKVEKTGYNSYSKYHYITESDVNKAILPALLECGLVMTTSVESLLETPPEEGSKNRFASVRLKHTIIDTDTGEVLELYSSGVGADTLDKSVYKAVTGACKYFALKLFMISGDDSDPENDADAKPATASTTSSKGIPKAASGKGFFGKKTNGLKKPSAEDGETSEGETDAAF